KFRVTGHNSGTIDTLLAAGFSNVQTLNGGSGADTFFFPNTGVSQVDGDVNGGAGSDTPDYTGYTGATVHPFNFTATGIGGHFSSIENFINVTFVGSNTPNVWHITGTDSGTIDTTSGTFSFSQANLVGGTDTDDFRFEGGSISGTINGGGGVNTI